MLCVKASLNCSSGCGEEEFLKVVNLFSLFDYNYMYLPLVKSVILQQKLKFHSIKDTLCLVWLKLAQWFWRDRLIYIFKKVPNNDYNIDDSLQLL